MPRPTKEQARALRDKWLLPLTTYYNELAGPSHLAYLKSTALFNCVSAANQSGKTTAMQAKCVARLLGKDPFLPNFSPRRILVIITRTDQAATVWGKRLLKACELPGDVGKLPWIDPHYIRKVNWKPAQKFGRYPGSFECINGSEYYMALAGDPDSWLGLEGLKFDDVFRDEATGNESLTEELEPRLWVARSDSGKPGAGGTDWGATETKDNEEYRKFRTACQAGTANHAYFYFPTAENSSVKQEVREAARSRMSEESYQVRALGIGSTSDRVKIYAPHWKPEVHEVKDRYHIRPDDNLRISFDPGWRDKCGIMCSVVSRDNPRQVKVVRWFSYKFGGFNHAVMDMKSWLDGRTCTRLTCDSQIHATMQHNGRTYYQEFCDLLATHGVKIHADPLWNKPRLEDSIPIVQDALQNHGASYDPYRNSLVCYTEEPGVADFVGELLNYRWKIDREGNVLRETVQKNIEAADCCRYELFQAPQWMDYGSQHCLTQEVQPTEEAHMDPDVALQRARFAEAERIWAEEGAEEGSPDQIGLASW